MSYESFKKIFDDEKLEATRKKEEAIYKKTYDTDLGKIPEIDRSYRPSSSTEFDCYDSPLMRSSIMSNSKLFESLRILNEEIDSEIDALDNEMDMDTPIGGDENTNDAPSIGDEAAEEIKSNPDDLLKTLNDVFTPILIMQGLESDVQEQMQESCSEGNVLFERNVIQFDNATRYSQLVSICSMLLQKQKNTEKWRSFIEAKKLADRLKVEMQKENYDEAKTLAQKYLVMVSTTSNSSVARQSANKLLPETQH